MDDQARGGPRSDDLEPAGLSPVRAFLVVGAVLAVAAGALLATRDASPATPTAQPSRSPDYSLTDAEAIAEFEQLRSAAFLAIRNRDVSLLNEVFVPGGALYRRASREIEALIDEGVEDRSAFTSMTVDVLRNSPTRIEIRERSRLEPCFKDAGGVDVTRGPAAVLQVAEWTLILNGSEWLLQDAVISRDKVLSGQGRSCD